MFKQISAQRDLDDHFSKYIVNGNVRYRINIIYSVSWVRAAIELHQPSLYPISYKRKETSATCLAPDFQSFRTRYWIVERILTVKFRSAKWVLLDYHPHSTTSIHFLGGLGLLWTKRKKKGILFIYGIGKASPCLFTSLHIYLSAYLYMNINVWMYIKTDTLKRVYTK